LISGNRGQFNSAPIILESAASAMDAICLTQSEGIASMSTANQLARLCAALCDGCVPLQAGRTAYLTGVFLLNLIRAPLALRPWSRYAYRSGEYARFAVCPMAFDQLDFLPERTFMSTYAKGPELGIVRELHEASLRDRK
jgi:hypothetical protein